jgi:hypothetical protein
MRLRELNPFIVWELTAGDHIAGAVGIISLPTMEECAGIMSLWPHALAGEYKYKDSDAMFDELFFQIAQDSSSLSKNFNVRHVGEKRSTLFNIEACGWKW